MNPQLRELKRIGKRSLKLFKRMKYLSFDEKLKIFRTIVRLNELIIVKGKEIIKDRKMNIKSAGNFLMKNKGTREPENPLEI